MDEENKHSEEGKTPIENMWYKRPGVIIGGIVFLIIIGYFSLPLLNQFDSPFTTYKPLDIDSTLLKLDTFPLSKQNDKITPPDSISIKDTTSLKTEKIIDTATLNDSSLKVDLLKLNTSYQHLDPNEQLGILKDDELNDDLFSQLVLRELSESENDELSTLVFSYGLKPVLRILSTTAVEILAGEGIQYHYDILDAIEDSSIIKGILIVDNDDRVIYSTNRKLSDQLIKYIYPGLLLEGEKLLIQESSNDKIISLPVHHPYGKLGMIFLIIESL